MQNIGGTEGGNERRGGGWGLRLVIGWPDGRKVGYKCMANNCKQRDKYFRGNAEGLASLFLFPAWLRRRMSWH